MDSRDIFNLFVFFLFSHKFPVKMLFLTNKCFITISIILSCVLICSAQTDFGYPEDSQENMDKRNKDVSISTQLFFNTKKIQQKT